MFSVQASCRVSGFTLSAWVLTLVCASGSAPLEADDGTVDQNVEQKLIELESKWSAATIAKNADAAEPLLSKDFLYTLGNGKLIGKSELLRLIAEETDHYLSGESSDFKVQGFGTSAVVHGIWTVRIATSGAPVTHKYRWTDTWLLESDGQWRCVASHTTRLE